MNEEGQDNTLKVTDSKGARAKPSEFHSMSISHFSFSQLTLTESNNVIHMTFRVRALDILRKR